MAKSYLGDSVYVESMETGDIRIYLDNGYGPHEIIWLEPDVAQKLVEFINLYLCKEEDENEDT